MGRSRVRLVDEKALLNKNKTKSIKMRLKINQDATEEAEVLEDDFCD